VLSTSWDETLGGAAFTQIVADMLEKQSKQPIAGQTPKHSRTHTLTHARARAHTHTHSRLPAHTLSHTLTRSLSVTGNKRALAKLLQTAEKAKIVLSANKAHIRKSISVCGVSTQKTSFGLNTLCRASTRP